MKIGSFKTAGRIMLGCLWLLPTGIVIAQANGTMSQNELERFSLLRADMAVDDQRFFKDHLEIGILPRIPSSFDYDALGLFCKLDVQFEKHLKFPLLFRLGDAHSVIEWEGKGPLRIR